jgi:hypothetical protein
MDNLTPEQQRKLSEAMGRPWIPGLLAQGDSVCLYVEPIRDFQVFARASEAGELLSEWRDLLESHLQGYIRRGKDIPHPNSWVTVVGPSLTGNGLIDGTQFIVAGRDLANLRREEEEENAAAGVAA